MECTTPDVPIIYERSHHMLLVLQGRNREMLLKIHGRPVPNQKKQSPGRNSKRNLGCDLPYIIHQICGKGPQGHSKNSSKKDCKKD